MNALYGLEESVGLAAQTAPEIATTAEREGSILVLPVGSLEQHGAHLPVATDSLLASTVASVAASDVSEDLPILVSPAVWSGYSPHHMSLGGTATVEFDTLHRLLEEVAASLLDNGFDALLLLNGHGGNKAAISAAVSTIGREQPDAEVLGMTYFDLATEAIAETRSSELGGMAHAGEFETSLMVHLYPELVSREMPATPLEDSYELTDDDLVASGPLSVYRPFEEYAESGAIGAPELATAETGEILFEALVEELADLLRTIHENNR